LKWHYKLKKRAIDKHRDKQKALKEIQSEATKRLSANIPESDYRELKIKAASEDTTINDLTLKWVKKYLGK